jgi:dihydropteroate synthase
MPKLMGIVNVTPDSFSDGGKYFDPATAVEHALQLADEGADILDIGGESTRPFAESIDAGGQLKRVMPVLEQLATHTDVPLSIDTSCAAVAEAALAAGVQIINDVTGLESDPQMLPLAVQSQAGVCVMHMQGTPQTMQLRPRYKDVVACVTAYLASRRDALLTAGMDRQRICLDPGIGFGKSLQHNLTLMSHCRQFHTLECPLLVGHSRKGFLGKILGDPKADRLPSTLGAALALASQGVQILRVHEIRPLREALLAYAATGGIDARPLD